MARGVFLDFGSRGGLFRALALAKSYPWCKVFMTDCMVYVYVELRSPRREKTRFRAFEFGRSMRAILDVSRAGPVPGAPPLRHHGRSPVPLPAPPASVPREGIARDAAVTRRPGPIRAAVAAVPG